MTLYDPGIYIHIPFCQRKCSYCDFNSYAGQQTRRPAYLLALRTEIQAASDDLPTIVRGKTLYIGGGTPTILPSADLVGIVEAASDAFALPQRAEVTVEANPGTLDERALYALIDGGVTRLSIGVQSFNEPLLRMLGRIHSAQEAVHIVQTAQAVGFNNVNLDLIFGLPRQTMDIWKASLEQALALAPQHLSLYALTVEEGTPLAVQIERKELLSPDDDLAADMYEWAETRLADAGYEHYEISNWAQPGFTCQHNLIYWRNEPYLGLGAGAHSWGQGHRRANLDRPADYIEAIAEEHSPAATDETISTAIEMAETMFMGLRLLKKGVSTARFETRFGRAMDTVYGVEIAQLVDEGLLERTVTGIRLTTRGHLLGNQVFERFVDAPDM